MIFMFIQVTRFTQARSGYEIQVKSDTNLPYQLYYHYNVSLVFILLDEENGHERLHY